MKILRSYVTYERTKYYRARAGFVALDATAWPSPPYSLRIACLCVRNQNRVILLKEEVYRHPYAENAGPAIPPFLLDRFLVHRKKNL